MAELALAIAPLCLSAIAGIKIARKKLKVLRHHDKEIKRLRKKFTAQTDTFLDECQLLFQDFLDPEEAEAIVEDLKHPQWFSPELSEQVKNHLGRKYTAYMEAVEEVKSNTEELNQGLDKELKDQTRRGKMKEAIDVTFNKSKYESLIEGLKESIQEIKRIRKTTSKILQCQTKASAKRSRPLPSFYQDMMQHSKSFHDALRSFWSCFQAQHTSHDVRLLLDSRNDGSLRVIVRYHTTSGLQAQEGLIDLFVRSQDLRLIHISAPSLPLDSRKHSDEPKAEKRRRVTFLEDTPSPSMGAVAMPSKGSSAASPSLLTSSTNLCSETDMCSHLCHQSGTALCGGYLDTPDQLRHHVYPACDSKCDHRLCLGKKKVKPAPLDKIFDRAVERSISVPDQLRIALRLVRGVLQFHDTPWLQPYWKLQDLSYFTLDESLATSLNTLHISTELSKHQKDHQDAIMMESGTDVLAAQRACGIRNLTMHSLGVALLQIGSWNGINLDDVVEVRRIADLAERDSRLGPKYQKITQQCLDCDFGFGKDLSQPELQSAIYKDVVCELESLIYTLEGKPQSLISV